MHAAVLILVAIIHALSVIPPAFAQRLAEETESAGTGTRSRPS